MSNIVIGNYLIESNIYDIVDYVKSISTNGKLSSVRKVSTGLKVTCPCHANGLEKDSSCFINDDGIWHCFACGEKGYIDKFVSRSLDCSLSSARSLLIHRYGREVNSSCINLESININKPINKVRYLDESILDNYQSYHPYMDKRKLSHDVCTRFKVKYDDKSKCLVFPVWDVNNNLVMLTRRSVLNKNFIIDKNVDKPVYLLNFTETNNIDYAILVESQINCLWLHTIGLNSIATFGCNVTDKQMKLINTSSIKYLIIAFDGDDAGREGTQRVLSRLRKDIFVDVLKLPERKDVNDLSREEVIDLLNNQNISCNELIKVYNNYRGDKYT